MQILNTVFTLGKLVLTRILNFRDYPDGRHSHTYLGSSKSEDFIGAGKFENYLIVYSTRLPLQVPLYRIPQ